MTHLADQAGTADYTYDQMGRLKTETRVIGGVSKGMSYDYNLDSSVRAIHYPSGAVVSYSANGAGRTISAKDQGNSVNYADSATFSPGGQMAGFISGSGPGAAITNTFSYNKRLQPINMSASAPSQTVFFIGYDFHLGNGNNGNVYNIYNYRDRNRDQSFAYDALNRLTSAQNAGTNCAAMTVNSKTEYWGNNYAYDAWGNLTTKSITKCSAENMSLAVAANNRISTAGYGYDAAGNMTADPTEGGITLTYDPENRITGAAGYTYTYDADGNRVKKTNGSTTTLYWYMTPGIVGESDASGTMKSEYVFFNGERVARRDNPGTPSATVAYYFSDHLKTASVVTDAAGVVKADSDYYPWGGELQFVANDSNHYKFTGKERDTETNLDYFGARYYSNGMGRFITPDWAAKATAVPYATFGDPQTLNLYAYVGNNPVNRVDLDGHISHEFDGLSSALNAGPAKDEGGSTSTDAAQTLAKMNAQSSMFGWQWDALQAPQPGVPASTSLNSVDTVAISTLDATNPKSIQESAEYSADLYQTKTGEVSSTAPARLGDPTAAQSTSPAPNPSAVPKGTVYVGDLHTHGSGQVVINGVKAQTDPEHFSPDDKKASWAASRKAHHISPGYLETPSGTVKKFTPANIKGMIPGSGSVQVLNRKTGTWETE